MPAEAVRGKYRRPSGLPRPLTSILATDEPPGTPSNMTSLARRIARVALTPVVAGALCAPSGLAGQSVGRFEVGLYAGSLSLSLLGLVNGTISGIGGPGGLDVDADVKAESSTLVGGELGGRVSPSLRVRLRVARTTTHMRLIARTGPLGALGPQTFTFDGLGDVVVWLADVDVAWSPRRFALPVAPYVFGGVGASSWDISGLEDVGALPPLLESPVNLSPVNSYLPGAVVGVGVELGSFGPLTAEVELADHVTGDPLADDDFHIGAEFAGFGRAKDLVHNFCLTAGVHLALGR